jgi:hypothetical protein
MGDISTRGPGEDLGVYDPALKHRNSDSDTKFEQDCMLAELNHVRDGDKRPKSLSRGRASRLKAGKPETWKKIPRPNPRAPQS